MSDEEKDAKIHMMGGAHSIKVAQGELANDVLGQLYRPLRELRQILAVVVEKVDRHISGASGPSPMSWSKVEEIRQHIADAYLLGRRVSRLANEVVEATGYGSTVAELCDVNKLVESAVALTRHRFSACTNVFVDLGAVAPVRVIPGKLVLVIAVVLTSAANDVFSLDGAKVEIRTLRELDQRGEEHVSIYIVQPGQPATSLASDQEFARALVAETGGLWEVRHEPPESLSYLIQFPAENH